DGDGTPGGDRADEFFRLYGDGDGDRDVDLLDLGRFLGTLGRRRGDPHFLGYLDYDGDGRVGPLDLLALAGRLGPPLDPWEDLPREGQRVGLPLALAVSRPLGRRHAGEVALPAPGASPRRRKPGSPEAARGAALTTRPSEARVAPAATAGTAGAAVSSPTPA